MCMAERFYHGRGEEGLLDIARNGAIKGFPVEDDDRFPELEPEINVYGKEEGVWITDSRECAKAYAWGGGYLEIDADELKVVEDRNTCYAVVMQDEITLDHVDRIMVERREGDPEEPTRNLDLEIAQLLDPEYSDMKIGTYEAPEYEIDGE